MMQRLFLIAAAALGLSTLSAGPAAASAADRAYLAGKLQFVYLANPNDRASAAAVSGPAVVSAGQFTPNPALTVFRDMIQALLSGTPAGGLTADAQERFQSVTASILRVTDRPIRVVLVNDLGGPITSAASINTFSLALSDHTGLAGNVIAARRVWPAAMVVGSDPSDNPAARQSSPTGGSFAMGAYRVTQDAGNFPNFTAVLFVFCHELTHTQDLSYVRWEEFRVLNYGNDNDHYFTEAIPSMASAYGEGLANFAGWAFARRNMDQVAAWFATDGHLLVEKPPASPGPGVLPPDVYNYATLDESKRVKTPTGNAHIDATYGVWPISALPPKMLLHNEQMIALVLYHRAMATKNGFDEVFAAFRKMNPGTYRVSTSAWAQLIDRLCTDLLPPGVSREAVGRVEVGPALLPLALCDYFTLFRAKDEAEMVGMFEGQAYLKDWVSTYFASARPAVRDAVARWKAAHPLPAGAAASKTLLGQREAEIARVIARTLGAK